MKKVVIIGGMAGGCKTAARLGRLDPTAEITIVERLPFVSFGACGMPFFVRGDVDDFNQLMSTAWGTVRSPEYFLEAKKINVLTETICTRIIPEQNKIEVQDKSGNRKVLDYDYLVIATGSKPAIPKFSFPRSERISFFHSPLDALKLRKFAEQGKISDAIIIGGGFIGCELAEALSSLWGIDVVVLEKENHLVPRSFDPEISYLLEKVMEENGIKIYTVAVCMNVQNQANRDKCCLPSIKLKKNQYSGKLPLSHTIASPIGACSPVGKVLLQTELGSLDNNGDGRKRKPKQRLAQCHIFLHRQCLNQHSKRLHQKLSKKLSQPHH